MRILSVLLFLLISSTSAWARPVNLKAEDSEWVETKLKRLGFSNSFSEESAKYYEPKGFKSVVKLNLLGFLTPSGAHLTELDPKAVQKSATFIKANSDAFQAAQKQFGVPAEVVSSLLYIETRHGADMGIFHIVSVYVHLMQVNSPENLKELTRLAILKNKEIKKYSTTKEVREIMKRRVESKAKWAEEQLIALAEIRKKKHLNLKKLRGSYAGAFGLPQFIPSSYRDFAEALVPESTPDITKPADAIMSVANYLQKSGWKQKNLEAQVTALMKYNNSRDYANGILNISQRVPPLPRLDTTATIQQTQ
ncbi:lytic murein transglycosylase [Bdellovibrio sp. KM01]|uniref:lytic murein transglycosylase n=1 Tax=Bdellovibrio sp. KM01 TaxID=2748865 RepID=UPI0015E9A3AA|nr:lytic murein transglycosylase [Bdellovibrio sp. KM01]QLY24129.1 lytic murein transglycosylase [Bdellovibrio sp. KM01]